MPQPPMANMQSAMIGMDLLPLSAVFWNDHSWTAVLHNLLIFFNEGEHVIKYLIIYFQLKKNSVKPSGKHHKERLSPNFFSPSKEVLIHPQIFQLLFYPRATCTSM